jgi:acetyl-CoA C-acetyltransferase
VTAAPLPPLLFAYIYDAVRTPRGKRQVRRRLHEVTPIHLATTALKAVRDRNNLDTALVDDVVLGCVGPVGEQGANIARVAALNAGSRRRGRRADQPLLRLGPRGLQHRRGQGHGRPEPTDDRRRRGKHEPRAHGLGGGAWPTDPAVAFPTYFVPQGISADLIATLYGYSREDVDAYAVESQKRAAQAWAEGRFARSIVPVREVNGLTVLDRDEHMRPDTTPQSLAKLKPRSPSWASSFGFDAVALQRYPEWSASSTCTTPAIRRASSTAPPPC